MLRGIGLDHSAGAVQADGGHAGPRVAAFVLLAQDAMS